MKGIKRICMAALVCICLLITVLPVGVFAADTKDTASVKVKEVSLGTYHSAAIKEDGSLWTWGNNEWGQLGNGEYMYADRVTPIKIMEDVEKVSLGYEHSAAIKEDRSLWM